MPDERWTPPRPPTTEVAEGPNLVNYVVSLCEDRGVPWDDAGVQAVADDLASATLDELDLIVTSGSDLRCGHHWTEEDDREQ